MVLKLKHYGMPRRSGRYPWGSGDNEYQRNTSFLGEVTKLKRRGLKETEIAKGLGLTTSQLRIRKSLIKTEERKSKIAEATRLKDKGLSNVEIGKKMNLNESSVRNLLNPVFKQRGEIVGVTSDVLRDNVNKKKYIDVGVGVENHLGISRTRLKTAIGNLEKEGYKVHYIQVEQLGTGKKTTVMTLAAPGTTYSEVFQNRDKIKTISEYSEDGGRSFLGLEPIRSVKSNRIQVRYAEDGGAESDGIIELRRGVSDISLGKSKYAQVRIGVDDTHFLKGMALYSDDLPDGIDIRFNTNKSKSVPKLDTMKSLKDDPDNPFGSTVRQRHYIDSDGTKKLSAINIVNEEGDWAKWSKTLSAQFLAKQSPALAKKQLDLSMDLKREEFAEIMSLTNPAVRKRLLTAFADDCDASSVHLKAAALPRQASHILLPIRGMKQGEVYAPNYRDGETVVLVRYPHGGTFEIPQLIVNNKSRSARRIMENAVDAIGINPSVAKKLSGADFDGDTVLVIPNNNRFIRESASLRGLKSFDHISEYPAVPGMVRMSARTKQTKMGDISNLITDMTIKGANVDELARAVRHSMVVIDAEKHNLNYKRSFVDHGIASLKKKYQGGERRGAATLISRAASEVRVGARKTVIDPKTGRKIHIETKETFIDKTKKPRLRTISSTRMAEIEDATKLSSGTLMENIYATYANRLKALANNSRKEMMQTKPIVYSPSAKITYSTEVASLRAKLNIALKNKPLERQAQLLANSVIRKKRQQNPNLDAAEIKKLKGQALVEARLRTGAKKQQIEINNKEWDAIQAGAISNNFLNQILNNTDLDRIKKFATPRESVTVSKAKAARARAMAASGFTQSEIAESLGISVALLRPLMKGE